MADQSFPMIVRNNSQTFQDILGLLKNFFHEKKVVSISLIGNNKKSRFDLTYKGKVDSGYMYVKGENGRIYLSRRSDFGVTYIIKPYDQVCIEENRLTFPDGESCLILFTE